MKKYTLITGSLSGIGFELAKNISQYSNVILHGSRDYNKIEKLRLQLSNPKNHLCKYISINKNQSFIKILDYGGWIFSD